MHACAVTLRAALRDAAEHTGPQPLADISLGAGRLASSMVQAITNPKEDKDLAKKRKEWQRKQDEEKAREDAKQQQQEEQQQLDQQAAAALVDPLGLADSAAAVEGEVVAAADAVAADVDAAVGAAAAVPEAVAAAGERSIVSEYTGTGLAPQQLRPTEADCAALAMHW